MEFAYNMTLINGVSVGNAIGGIIVILYDAIGIYKSYKAYKSDI